MSSEAWPGQEAAKLILDFHGVEASVQLFSEPNADRAVRRLLGPSTAAGIFVL